MVLSSSQSESAACTSSHGLKPCDRHHRLSAVFRCRVRPVKADYKKRFRTADRTQRWAVTETKWAIRRALRECAWPRWHFVTFCGKNGKESRGVVDMIAIRKDHESAFAGLKRGDTFQIVLIQVKGGSAANPTAEDAERLRIVGRRYHAQKVLLSTWQKGGAAQFFLLDRKTNQHEANWSEIADIKEIFGNNGNSM